MPILEDDDDLILLGKKCKLIIKDDNYDNVYGFMLLNVTKSRIVMDRLLDIHINEKYNTFNISLNFDLFNSFFRVF